jgi:preprotein translocase subunit SecG
VDTTINFVVIAVVALLVITVLLQSSSSQGGGLFGGGGGTVRTRRGVEKTLFQFTIALAVIFVALAIVNIRFG